MQYTVNIAHIEQALLDLGGVAKAKSIQEKILADYCGNKIPDNYQHEKSFRQTIQRKIEDYCSDAEGFDPLKKEAKFFRIGRGIYRLASSGFLGGARFYWVNVGATYDEVVNAKFLWAPQFGVYPIDPEDPNKGTRKRHLDHWTNVGSVRSGDIIFGNLDRQIVFVAVATNNAVASQRPEIKTFKQWNDVGYRVDIELFPLMVAVPVDGEVKGVFDSKFNELCSPKVFKLDGDIFQGYMAALPDACGVQVLRLAGDVEVMAVEASESIRSLKHGKAKVQHRPTSGTTKQAIHEARIGQGYFRQQLLDMWKTCPVTGVGNPDLLLASHVKPWAKSDDDERLDPYNGFLFSPNVDRAFDKGLISFDDTGKILINHLLSQQDCTALGIHSAISIPIHPNHIKYLAAHRKLFDM